MTSTGASEYKPIRTERHVTFTSSFASLSVSLPNASTSENRDVNVNTNVNVAVNVLRKQVL